jgi:hypothetical protein
VAAPRTAIARQRKKIKIVRYIHTYYYWTTIYVNKVAKSFLGWVNLLPYIFLYNFLKKFLYVIVYSHFFSLYIFSLFWTKKPQQPPKENLILKRQTITKKI